MMLMSMLMMIFTISLQMRVAWWRGWPQLWGWSTPTEGFDLRLLSLPILDGGDGHDNCCHNGHDGGHDFIKHHSHSTLWVESGYWCWTRRPPPPPFFSCDGSLSYHESWSTVIKLLVTSDSKLRMTWSPLVGVVYRRWESKDVWF